jgi:dephospho-CoA kinase
MLEGHYVVGLTGGVAAGKSAVERRFTALGVGVHDADRGARTVVEPGTDGLGEIAASFGSGVLNTTGALDRAAMRRRIFDDPSARKRLEAIVHPRVRQWTMDHVRDDTGPYCIVAIPLLVENLQHYAWLDRILVVDASIDTQLARLTLRDGIDDTLARRMVAQQSTREERLSIATDVIHNDGAEDALDDAVARLHQQYLSLASHHR